MKFKKAYCFLLNVLVYLTSFGQEQKITPVSPEAAALAKMVNYPVNLNTGVPDISIPLYTINTGGMVLPIILQYHAGGFNINEHSPRTGLGWSLSCDLQITRTINGLDDFNGYIADSRIKSHGDPANNYPLGYSNWQNDYRLANGLYDGAPDKFNYKLLNKSGSFYFKKDNSGTGYTIVPVPYDNIRVEFAYGRFIITDTDGTSYLFGVSGDTEETDLITTAWKCTSITNANNTETIHFNYEQKAAENYYSRTESIEYYNNPSSPNCGFTPYTYDKVNAAHPGSYTYEQLTSYYPFYWLSSPKYFERFAGKPSIFHLPFATSPTNVEDHAYPVTDWNSGTVRTVNGLALSSIEFTGGKVEFSGIEKLTSIKIRQNDNSLLRSYDFYLTESGGYRQGVKPTFYLDALLITNSDGSLKERYNFLYKNKYPFGDDIIGKDAWGYAHAATTNFEQSGQLQLTVPRQEITQPFYFSCEAFFQNVTFSIGNAGNSELVDREGAQRGILSRIIYPTGGYVNFDFESNKYKEDGAGSSLSVQMGGGLRIRSITNYDGKSMKPASQKYYRYGEQEDGLGLVVNAPPKTFNGSDFKYNAYSYSQDVAYVQGSSSPQEICSTRGCLELIAKEVKTTYLPASSQNYTYPNGAQIYYTKVTEYNSDLGVKTGKTAYTFYPPYEFTQIYPNKIPGTNIDYQRSDGLMGQLKRTDEYKFKNGRYSLVHSKEFEYTKYSQATKVKVVYSFNGSQVQLLGGTYTGNEEDLYNPNIAFMTGGGTLGSYSGVQGFTSGQYGIEVGKLQLTGETEKWVTDGGILTQRTTYQYSGDYQQPSMIETVGSDGRAERKYLKYCYDFPNQTVYTQMLAKNMISSVIEEQVEVGGVTIRTTRTNYDVFSVGFIAPKSVERSLNSGPMTTEIQYDLYDNKGNLLQSTGRDGIIISYIWGYQQQYVLAKIAGLSYAAATAGMDMVVLQTVTSEDQLRNTFNNLRTAHPQALISSFTHKPLIGITSITDPAGLIRFFQFDPAGRLSVIKNNNGEIQQTYSYQMMNEVSSLALDRHTAIPGDIESYNLTIDPNTRMIYNYTIPGGVRNFYGTNVPPPYLISDEEALQHPPTAKDGLAVADVLIELYSWFINTKPIPSGFHLDLLKDGHVVYTKTFKYNSNNQWVPVQFYIPHGEYQVNLRVDENFDNHFFRNYFYSAAGAGQPENDFMLNGPVTVNFVPGVTYAITSLNY